MMGEYTLCADLYRCHLNLRQGDQELLRFVATASRREVWTEDGQRHFRWQFIQFREVV